MVVQDDFWFSSDIIDLGLDPEVEVLNWLSRP